MPPKSTMPEPVVTTSMSGGTTIVPDPAMEEMKAKIAFLTSLVEKMAANQPPVSANHRPEPVLPKGVWRVVATKRGTYPNVDLVTGKKITRAFIRNVGEVFYCLAEDFAKEPEERDDAPHGWMRQHNPGAVFATAPDAPPTPVAQLIPDPLASVPIDPDAPKTGGFIQR